MGKDNKLYVIEYVNYLKVFKVHVKNKNINLHI